MERVVLPTAHTREEAYSVIGVAAEVVVGDIVRLRHDHRKACAVVSYIVAPDFVRMVINTDCVLKEYTYGIRHEVISKELIIVVVSPTPVWVLIEIDTGDIRDERTIPDCVISGCGQPQTGGAVIIQLAELD
jgi:hypothetical protein